MYGRPDQRDRLYSSPVAIQLYTTLHTKFLTLLFFSLSEV